MDISELLTKMFLFFLMLLVGYISARKGIFTEEFTKGAGMLVINIFGTAAIINSVLDNRPEMAIGELFGALGIMALTEVICCLIALLICRLLPRKDKSENLTCDLAIGMMNIMYVGVPVVQELCGSQAVFYLAIACVPFNLLMFIYGVYRIIAVNGGTAHIRVADIFSAPLVAAFAAAIIFIFDLQLPRLITETVKSAAGAAAPMSMVVIGSSMGSAKLREIFSGWRVYFVTVFRLLICPVLIWLLFRQLVDNQLLLISAVIMAACPTGMTVPPVLIKYGQPGVLASECVMATTLLSLLTIPALVFILF